MPSPPHLRRSTVVLGVGGGIAAYKACELARRLQDHGLRVRVMMTAMAQQFVTPLTFQALTGEAVLTDLTDPRQDAAYGHLDLARSADLLVIAPVTADLLASLAHGHCNDPVTTTAVASTAPLLLCPAMNSVMWQNRQVVQNVSLLRADPRVHLVGPAEGLLADGDRGIGRLADVPEIVERSLALLASYETVGTSLAGQKWLVTAGPTREPLDPVRFLSNPSSGRMGYAIAEAAARRGAQVELVSGPVALAPPGGVRVSQVETAEEMQVAALALLPGSAVVIGAAAVSDFRPRQRLAHKRKKDGVEAETLTLERTADVLLSLSSAADGLRPRPLMVGFAAETEDLVGNARRKLAAKRLDLVAANWVGSAGSGFGGDLNALLLVTADAEESLPRQPKRQLAERLIDRVVQMQAPVR